MPRRKADLRGIFCNRKVLKCSEKPRRICKANFAAERHFFNRTNIVNLTVIKIIEKHLENMTIKIYTIHKAKRLFMKRRKTYGKCKKRFSYKNQKTQKRK